MHTHVIYCMLDIWISTASVCSLTRHRKKFQNLEEERIKQMKRQEKTNRGKAHLYSKQTAQRQK